MKYAVQYSLNGERTVWYAIDIEYDEKNDKIVWFDETKSKKLGKRYSLRIARLIFNHANQYENLYNIKIIS